MVEVPPLTKGYCFAVTNVSASGIERRVGRRR
jgi:hypothetical protein